MIPYISGSEQDTEMYGRRLAPRLPAGCVLALYGDLGSGKTVLTRGLLRGLGYLGPVVSPTFSIVHEYPAGRDGITVNTAHFDLYRIRNEQDLESTGFYDYLTQGWTLILEWSDRIPWAIEESFLRLTIGRSGEENGRTLCLEEDLPC